MKPTTIIPRFSINILSEIYDEKINWGIRMLGMPKVWSKYMGDGVRVAVLDTGCDAAHPDLIGAVVGERDFSGSLVGAMDTVGHGSHCAGIIGARANGNGCIGVAPKCEILVAKVFGDKDESLDEWIVDAIQWSVENGAKILNMSFGGALECQSIRKAIAEANSRGCYSICSAGNMGYLRGFPFYPAAYDETVSVGAINRLRFVTDFSGRGNHLDVVAPGTNIISTFKNGKYASMSGTSMACPFVVGMGALLLAKHNIEGGATPIDSFESFRQHIINASLDAGKIGFDRNHGYGIINPKSLLKEE